MKTYTFTSGPLFGKEPSCAASVKAGSFREAQLLLAGLIDDRSEEGGVQNVWRLVGEGSVTLHVRLPLEAILDTDNWECEDDENES